MRARGQASSVLCECGDHAFANLTQGFVTLVSPEDRRLLCEWWQVKEACNHPYAVTRKAANPGSPKINRYLHREILEAPANLMVDHKNGDTLDNRRANLRLATASDNNANRRLAKERSLPKGVYRMPDGSYCASICRDGRKRYLGRFSEVGPAHAAYCEAALVHHGKFARFE